MLMVREWSIPLSFFRGLSAQAIIRAKTSCGRLRLTGRWQQPTLGLNCPHRLARRDLHRAAEAPARPGHPSPRGSPHGAEPSDPTRPARQVVRRSAPHPSPQRCLLRCPQALTESVSAPLLPCSVQLASTEQGIDRALRCSVQWSNRYTTPTCASIGGLASSASQEDQAGDME